MFPKHLVLYRKQQHELLSQAHGKEKQSEPSSPLQYICTQLLVWHQTTSHTYKSVWQIRSCLCNLTHSFHLKTDTLPLAHWATSKKIVYVYSQIHILHTNHAKTPLSFELELFSFYSLMPWQNRPVFRVMKTTWKLISHAQDIQYLTVWFSLDMLPCLS